jgi:hypothetical protein
VLHSVVPELKLVSLWQILFAVFSL